MTDSRQLLQPLGWDDGFVYPGLGTIYTHADSSSLIHAVLNGMWTPYQSTQPSTARADALNFRTAEDRVVFVRRQVRPALAEFLAWPASSGAPLETKPAPEGKATPDIKVAQERSTVAPESKQVYHTLAGGTVAQLSQYRSTHTLEALQELLNGAAMLEGDIVVEILIRAFRVNIFVLHAQRRAVIATGSLNVGVRLPDVGAVVALYRPGSPHGHYELVAVPNRNGGLDTHFALDHPLIVEILRYQSS